MVFGLTRGSPGPPDADAVLRRARVLKHVIELAFAAPPPEVVEELPEDTRRELIGVIAAETAERRKSVKKQGLDGELTAEERDFLRDGPLEAPDQFLINAFWSTESCGCLVWALGHREEFPQFDTPFDPADTLQAVREPASLRDRKEIEQQREIAELWHWRCRTRQLQEAGKLRGEIGEGMTIDDVIRMAATNAAGDADIPPPIDGDFPAWAKPFRELDEDEFSTITSIAMERHKALNWLCGYAPKNRWDEVPTDT